ncbi:DMT family transporter [candidate division KSB1 bacterium]|nr:DMT family transporter [candidate division KSB1 bacterium]
MKSRLFRANLLLLLTALIWGFAFVAQRVGMNYIGPFTFNALRFALGALVLLPFIFYELDLKNWRIYHFSNIRIRSLFLGGLAAGIVLFSGSTFQQMGIVFTTAGKAGFITGLYVVLVPILGYFIHKPSSLQAWMGATLAIIGLYFLSVTSDFSINKGDLLVLIGAFFWAIHVQLIGWLSTRFPVISLAMLQFLTCAILSLLSALLMEQTDSTAIYQAILPILYGGLFSVGIAFTLQVVAQRDAHPTAAAILLNLESVFAALGGWLLLNETLTLRNLIGCALILSGMLLAQIQLKLDFRNLLKNKKMKTEAPYQSDLAV